MKHSLGKFAEAESMHREGQAKLEKLVGKDHPNVITSQYNLAEVLRDQGKLAEAEALYRKP